MFSHSLTKESTHNKSLTLRKNRTSRRLFAEFCSTLHPTGLRRPYFHQLTYYIKEPGARLLNNSIHYIHICRHFSQAERSRPGQRGGGKRCLVSMTTARSCTHPRPPDVYDVYGERGERRRKKNGKAARPPDAAFDRLCSLVLSRTGRRVIIDNARVLFTYSSVFT